MRLQDTALSSVRLRVPRRPDPARRPDAGPVLAGRRGRGTGPAGAAAVRPARHGGPGRTPLGRLSGPARRADGGALPAGDQRPPALVPSAASGT